MCACYSLIAQALDGPSSPHPTSKQAELVTTVALDTRYRHRQADFVMSEIVNSQTDSWCEPPPIETPVDSNLIKALSFSKDRAIGEALSSSRILRLSHPRLSYSAEFRTDCDRLFKIWGGHVCLSMHG